MQQVRVPLLIYWLLFFSGTIARPPVEKMQWMTLQEAEAACKIANKPILIDLYTDWCGWCKVMDKKTYANKNVIQYISKNFYAVKLDAESKNAISWAGKNFQYNSSARVNDIATYLTEGRLSFPSTIIVPTDHSAPQAIAGYFTPRELEVVLKYFGEDKYGKVPFESFRQHFRPAW